MTDAQLLLHKPTKVERLDATIKNLHRVNLRLVRQVAGLKSERDRLVIQVELLKKQIKQLALLNP